MTPRSPHVVIDGRMANDGGIGTYLQALVPRIARSRPEWRITVLGDIPAMRALGWEDLPNIAFASWRARIFSIREQAIRPMPRDTRVDLYWAPNYNVPAMLGWPLAVTLHDVNHLALPELMGGPVRRGYARFLLTSAVRRASRLLFVSEFTRRETERLLNRACGHGMVVHGGVESDWTMARADAPDRPIEAPYFLYVGNIKRHKNLPLLLRAFARVQSAIPHRLVLIGRTEGLRVDPDVTPVLQSLGDRAVMLGEVSVDVLRRYVAHAEGLVTVSLYEGFGLPPLEAMAAGCPCIVSNAASLPEVCGDAALYCDPRDEHDVASALKRLAETPALRADLVRRGRERAAQFSWDRTALLTAGVLEHGLRNA